MPSTYSCDPLRLVRRSSSGAINATVLGAGLSGLGGLIASGGGTLNDGRLPSAVGAVTVLRPGTAYTS